MHIPDHVLEQIKGICKVIAREEWSGVLFYSTKGSFNDIGNFKITLEHIHLMDRGTSVFTEYETDESVVEVIMKNPTWNIGHIHSHNVMTTFFSGTDMSELQDNLENHNAYLSVIVNNYLDATAKIAFEAKTKTKEIQYYAKDSDGEEYEFVHEMGMIKKMFVYDCNILANRPEMVIEDTLLKRIRVVTEESKKRKLISQKAKRVEGANQYATMLKEHGHEFNVFDNDMDKPMIVGDPEFDFETEKFYEYAKFLLTRKENSDETMDEVVERLFNIDQAKEEGFFYIILQDAYEVLLTYYENPALNVNEVELYENLYTIYEGYEEEHGRHISLTIDNIIDDIDDE